jgi:hypothetical protein
MEARRNAYKMLVRKSEGKRLIEKDQDMGGWIILKWIFER